MFVRVITPPAPFVSYEEAAAHLRVDGEDDRVYIEALLSAACAWLDGPGGWLGRAIGLQTLEVVDCAFGNDRLPFPPLVEVESITYRGSDDADHDLVEAQYRVLVTGALSPLVGQNWPSLARDSEAVRIQYRAGYEDVPTPIKQAVLLIVGHWYGNRETVVTGTITAELPWAAEALLSTYRVWSV